MMFDIGWSELFVVGIVLLVVVGPKELPAMLRTFGRTTARMRGMAGEFRKQFDEAMKEAELDEVKKLAQDARKLDPTAEIRKNLNPLKKMGDDIRSGLNDAVKPAAKPAATGAADAVPAAPVAEVAPAPAAPAGEEPKGAIQPAPTAASADPAVQPAPAQAEAPAAGKVAAERKPATPRASRKPAAGKVAKGGAAAKPAASARPAAKPSEKSTEPGASS